MSFDQHITTLKTTLISILSNSILLSIYVHIPFIKTSQILNKLVSWGVEKMVTFLVNKTELSIFLVYTDFRTSSQGRAFYEAAQRNVEVRENGTEEEVKLAEDEVINRFRELVKFTN